MKRIFVLLALLLLSGCSGVPSEASSLPKEIPDYVVLAKSDALRGKKIGCSIVCKSDEWCVGVSNALEIIGDYYGVDITVEDGEVNPEVQTKQLENMMASHCDMIFCDPFSAESTATTMERALDQGIPMILFDSQWEAGQERAVASVSWDQRELGKIIGEYIIQYAREHMPGQPIRIVEIGILSISHVLTRFEGLEAALSQAEDLDIEILHRFDSQGIRETAYNHTVALIEPYDFIVTDSDISAMGACAALEALNNRDVKVFSMGSYGNETVTTLCKENSNYLSCVWVDPWTLVQNIYQCAINYYTGAENPKVVNIDLFRATRENVNQYWSFD